MLHESDHPAQESSTHARLTPPLKWHGGKAPLARRIVDLMPPHLHYVEPYAGGLAVLLAKDPEGVSEVASDLNADLVNFWDVLRHRGEELAGLAEASPFSEPLWRQARDKLAQPDLPPLTRAWAFFVVCRQSLAARMKGFASLSRTRTRQRMNEQASAWMGAVDGLPAVHARLRRVVILCGPALRVIRKEDGPGTLIYADPPYMDETRASTGQYAHEMTAAQHEELLQVLLACRGKVMLSGYRSDLYDRVLSHWTRRDFEVPNNAAGGKKKRTMTESLWCNFTPANGP